MSGKEMAMNMTINFVYYLNSEIQKQTLDQKQSLGFVHSYKVSRSRLQWVDIESVC